MNDDKKAKGGIGAVLMGAALGAAAVSLMNKSTRKKLKQSIMTALDKGDAKLDELSERAQKLKKNAADKAETLRENAKAKAVKELKRTERKLADTASNVKSS